MEATMFITGLCAFVPDSKGIIKVVLPAASSMEYHYAAILTLEKHLTPSGSPPSSGISSSRQPDFGFDGRNTFGYQRMVGFTLNNESIEIDQSSGTVVLDLTTLEGDCPTFPSSGPGGSASSDSTSLLWASQMKTLGAPVMNAKAFYFTDPSLVAAQVVFRGGALMTSGFAKNYRGKILKWEFKQTDGTTLKETRALAEEVQYIFEIDTSLRFVSSRSTNDITRDIELFPDSDGTLTCWLVNQPLEDMLFNRSTEPRPPIDHFVHFFEIAKNGSPSSMPYPVLDLCDSTIGGVSSPRCPVTFFDGHE